MASAWGAGGARAGAGPPADRAGAALRPSAGAGERQAQREPYEAVSSSVSAVPHRADVCRWYATTCNKAARAGGQRRAMVPRCQPSSGHQRSSVRPGCREGNVRLPARRRRWPPRSWSGCRAAPTVPTRAPPVARRVSARSSHQHVGPAAAHLEPQQLLHVAGVPVLWPAIMICADHASVRGRAAVAAQVVTVTVGAAAVGLQAALHVDSAGHSVTGTPGTSRCSPAIWAGPAAAVKLEARR